MHLLVAVTRELAVPARFAHSPGLRVKPCSVSRRRPFMSMNGLFTGPVCSGCANRHVVVPSRRRPLDAAAKGQGVSGRLREHPAGCADGVAVALGQRTQLTQRKRAPPTGFRYHDPGPQPFGLRKFTGLPGAQPSPRARAADRLGLAVGRRRPSARGSGCTHPPASRSTPLRSLLRSSDRRGGRCAA
jgi:hypothetical protein